MDSNILQFKRDTEPDPSKATLLGNGWEIVARYVVATMDCASMREPFLLCCDEAGNLSVLGPHHKEYASRLADNNYVSLLSQNTVDTKVAAALRRFTEGRFL